MPAANSTKLSRYNRKIKQSSGIEKKEITSAERRYQCRTCWMRQKLKPVRAIRGKTPRPISDGATARSARQIIWSHRFPTPTRAEETMLPKPTCREGCAPGPWHRSLCLFLGALTFAARRLTSGRPSASFAGPDSSTLWCSARFPLSQPFSSRLRGTAKADTPRLGTRARGHSVGLGPTRGLLPGDSIS